MTSPVAPTGARTAAVGASSTSSPAGQPGQQINYLKLIVAQMQNLNPMDPSSGSDSMPMMMQAESLNQLTMLNKSIDELAQMQQVGFAAGLLGRTVSGTDEGGNPVSGVVRGLQVSQSNVMLQLENGVLVPASTVTAVNTAAPGQGSAGS